MQEPSIPRGIGDAVVSEAPIPVGIEPFDTHGPLHPRGIRRSDPAERPILDRFWHFDTGERTKPIGLGHFDV